MESPAFVHKRVIEGKRTSRQTRSSKSVATIPSIPDDMISFDTHHSTPRTTGKMHSKKERNDDISLSKRLHQRWGRATSSKESFALPCSIEFLSLVLPHAGETYRIQEIQNKNYGKDHMSDIAEEDTTIGSCMSIMSGQTALAKDRVQETISSSMNIDYFFNSASPRSADAFPFSHPIDVPVNVDFVLESNEEELASFAKRCIRSGNYRDAIDIYDSVLNHYRNQHGKDHRLVILTLHNLGIVHTWNGNYNKALVHCSEALKLRRVKFGNGHADVASSLCELGIIHYAREDFNKALGALREALQIHSKVASCNQPTSRISSTLNNIGCIHFSMGKLIAGLSTLEECLDLQRRTMGSVVGAEVDRVLFNLSITLTNAATVAAKQGDHITAACLMEEGLMVQQSVLPDDHRFVSSVRNSLSRLEGNDIPDTEHHDSPNGLQIEIAFEACDTVICAPDQIHPIVPHRLSDDLHSFCAEMLSLGTPKIESSSEDRVQLHMNINRLPQALLAEGRSKRHCSWVDVSKRKSNTTDKGFNFLQISQKAANYVEVSLLSFVPSFLFTLPLTYADASVKKFVKQLVSLRISVKVIKQNAEMSLISLGLPATCWG